MSLTRSTADVVVIGSGIIGTSVAYRLAKAGLDVLVLERGRLGGEASLAAAGMLAPWSEWDHRDPPEFFPLCQRGLEEYTPLLAELYEETGYAVRTWAPGFLYLDLCSQPDKAKNRWLQQAERGIHGDWLDREQVLALEPNIEPSEIGGSIHYPSERVVHSLQLLEATRGASRKLGVSYETGIEVLDVEGGWDGVTVRCDSGLVTADHAVVAAGRQSSLLGDRLGVSLPVIPVRGEMMVLRAPKTLFRRVIYIPEGGCGSVIDRGDGTFIVGTTEEYGEGGSTGSVKGLVSIARRICRVAPGLADALVFRTWSGLRPCGPDRMPFIGRLQERPRILVATGHYRNGYLLGPLTGRLIAELVCTGDPSFPLERFAPDRVHADHEIYVDQL